MKGIKPAVLSGGFLEPHRKKIHLVADKSLCRLRTKREWEYVRTTMDTDIICARCLSKYERLFWEKVNKKNA